MKLLVQTHLLHIDRRRTLNWCCRRVANVAFERVEVARILHLIAHLVADLVVVAQRVLVLEAGSFGFEGY